MMRSLVGMAVLVLAPAIADAVLCTTKHGAVVERPSCKRKESPLDLAAAGATGRKGDPGARGTSTARLRAFDASGQPIGYVNAHGYIVVLHEGRALAITANEDGFDRNGVLYFAAPGCVGPAFVYGFGLLASGAPMRGNTAYYEGEPVAEYAYQSYQGGSAPPPDGCASGTYDDLTGLCCVSGNGTVLAGPAVPVDLGAFTPPFRVEVER